METVDARDMPCPEPVVRTKQALERITSGILTVLVNNPEACQNVRRSGESQGCSVQFREQDGIFTLQIHKTGPATNHEKTGVDVLLITGDQLGTGDKELGELLITSFINTLPEASIRPAKILFINRGVMLTTEGSRVLDTLQQLEQEGVQIFSCGTCLKHYNLQPKLKAGQVTNMYDTVNSLLTGSRVIRL